MKRNNDERIDKAGFLFYPHLNVDTHTGTPIHWLFDRVYITAIMSRGGEGKIKPCIDCGFKENTQNNGGKHIPSHTQLPPNPSQKAWLKGDTLIDRQRERERKGVKHKGLRFPLWGTAKNKVVK